MTDRLQPEHYQALALAMEQHTGIQFGPSKQAMLEGRLQRRVRATGLPNMAAYGAMLFEQDGLAAEFGFLVDCVTTNKTDFFREPDHFEFLRAKAVPALLAHRGRGRTLKLWSAACSTGAEAYTIAMVLDAMQDLGTRVDFSILGTDISTDVLAQAWRAIYPAAMLDPVPPEWRRRYAMAAADLSRDEVRIIPELRCRTQFGSLNLMDPAYPFDRDVDVIFCRNVLIYFAKQTQQAVLRRLAAHLRPGGYLIVGHSESMTLDDAYPMEQVLPTIYRHTGGAPAAGRAA